MGLMDSEALISLHKQVLADPVVTDSMSRGLGGYGDTQILDMVQRMDDTLAILTNLRPGLGTKRILRDLLATCEHARAAGRGELSRRAESSREASSGLGGQEPLNYVPGGQLGAIDRAFEQVGGSVIVSCQATSYMGLWGAPEPGSSSVLGTVHLIAVPATDQSARQRKIFFFAAGRQKSPALAVSEATTESIEQFSTPTGGGLQLTFVVMDRPPGSAPIDTYQSACLVCPQSYADRIFEEFEPAGAELQD